MKFDRDGEIVIFVGIPASGKTSFYKERFFPSHVYVSQDQLRTSSAVEELFRFCIRRNKNCVIDKCNISVLDRQKYIRVAHSHGAKAVGYCFVTKKEDALARNAKRPEATRVKEVAIRSAYSWMQYPKMQEGFDELYFVRIVNGEYVVQGRQGSVERMKFFIDREIPIFTSRDADGFWRQFA